MAGSMAGHGEGFGLSKTKTELRLEARGRRAKLVASDFANRIAAFADALNLPPHFTVAGYWPIRDEADPRELMKTLSARGHALALPRIEAKGERLSFRLWREGDELIDNHHAIAEPRADAERVVPDAILMPLLAFDATGHRLGYGGGYYDRTLEALKACAIGIAYAGQEIAGIPREPHDHPLNMIVTERGVRLFHQTPGTSR
jgi:5-formyltetrahydrofolate cyclo-ligase